MFDLEPGKLIVIAIVALIAIPSKDLPRVLRTLGQFTGKMRRMASEFQGQFMEAMREAELEDLRKEVSEMRDAVKESVKLDVAFDPMAEARKQIAGAIGGDAKPSPTQPPHPEEKPASGVHPTCASNVDLGQARDRGGVSKDDDAAIASFETQPSAAPQQQDEGSGLPTDSPKKAAT